MALDCVQVTFCPKITGEFFSISRELPAREENRLHGLHVFCCRVGHCSDGWVTPPQLLQEVGPYHVLITPTGKGAPEPVAFSPVFRLCKESFILCPEN